MMELDQLDATDQFTNTVTSQTVYFGTTFPNEYWYYFEFISNTATPVLLEHPFQLYYPTSIRVVWVHPNGTNGIYLIIGATPAFAPFGPLNIQIYIPQATYEAIVNAMNSAISSPDDLVPPPYTDTMGTVEFVILSTDAGYQIKIDLVNSPPYIPEDPVTVETLIWNEVLYWVMNLETFRFEYVSDDDLGITFIDPRYCFLREWITFPPAWTDAIKVFAGIG